MQKLYGIKCILIGLSAISLSLSGMKPAAPKSSRRHVKRLSIEAAQQEQDIFLFIKHTAVSHKELIPKIQEIEIRAFVNEIAQNNNAEIEALQQEEKIIWYTQVTSQRKTTASMPHPEQAYCPII